MPRASTLALLALLLAPSPARSEPAAERPAEVVLLPPPAGLARLVRPERRLEASLVILLPDALGEDGRADPYADSLLARGIATLVLGVGDGEETAPPSPDPAASAEAAAASLRWARQSGFAEARIGLAGFGLGGRAALLATEGQPVAALYPRCLSLAPPGQGDALLIQAAAEAEACDGIAGQPRVTLLLLPGAAHGWDAQGVTWPGAGLLLPDPAGPGRIPAAADPAATLRAAEALADWFAARLMPPLPHAAR
ncbi:dienelactone hydrolase family protein [Siccirubricoccus phaeus]|uniref:hypothetical protein n=1 Tax=Siccirubricoccus phaeus TaxID=2595053 RepID=UPI001A9C6BBD|nr:hypothetical protein [Siccirubricoccus phaeus]